MRHRHSQHNGSLPRRLEDCANRALCRLWFPLPWGEGQGEGVMPLSVATPRILDGYYPLTRRFAPPSPHGRGLIGVLPHHVPQFDRIVQGA